MVTGDAFVDTGNDTAVLATIYADRVVGMARAAGVAFARLLGYAIAHELGHLLLASPAHATDGLMRPNWLDRELRRRDVRDWAFSSQDAATIRSRLASQPVPNIVWTTR